MSNPYFHFKQFTVHHNLCAMKVGADGVTIGAWADLSGAKSILDVGTGSGLIALMAAQRNTDAVIDAIDIEENAVKQAQLNFDNSPWKNRLNVFHQSLQDWTVSAKNKYDLIISNPPYFQNSLKAPDLRRTTARHTDTLHYKELIDCAIHLLNDGGKLCLILPLQEGEMCIKYGHTKKLYCSKKVFVFPKPDAKAKRLLLDFSFRLQECIVSELTIETSLRHIYTPEYTALVKDFYLSRDAL